jgi:hypothetical protein
MPIIPDIQEVGELLLKASLRKKLARPHLNQQAAHSGMWLSSQLCSRCMSLI